MIPILFGSVDVLLVDEQNRVLTNENGELFTVPDQRMDFETLGIGALGECVSCQVPEGLNSKYELRMRYPVTGRRFKDLKPGAIIKATPSYGREPDYFEIYKVTKPISGIVEVNAQHISYQLSSIPVMPFTATSCAMALEGLKNNSAEANPFTFWTDKTTSANYRQTVPASVRSRLGGVSGSVLDVYGGEYEFDRYTVKLWANRGADNGVTLRYGKNITDLNQEQNIANTITGICPYWADNEGTEVVTLPEKVISSPKSGLFPYPRTVVKDFSQYFETKPTEAELRAKATAYVQSAGIGVPAVSIKVKFVDLSDTDEGGNVGLLERVKLGDTVTVIFEPFDIEAKAKVTEAVWNVLEDRYDEITLGNARTNLAGIVAANERAQEEALTSTKSALARAVDQATDQITGVNGGYVVINRDADGNPYELLIMNAPDIETATRVWRWNQNGLGVSNNGYNGPYETAMTADGHFVANFITAGTLIASLIKAGVLSDEAGNFYLDMETGELRMQNGTFTGSINSNDANITGGTISINTSSLYYDSIVLNYQGSSVSLSPARVVIVNAGNGYTAQYEGGGVLIKKTTGSSGATVYLAFGTYGGGLTLRTPDGSKHTADLVSTSSGGKLELYDANGTLCTELYASPESNAHLLGRTGSSSYTYISVGTQMARYRAFVLNACRGQGAGVMASTYIPYEQARLCTDTSVESWAMSAQNSNYSARCYFDFSANRIYICSSGLADCVVKVYGIT